jgi:tryptophan-rich sensory protein
MKILLKVLIFAVIYHYLKIEGTIAAMLIWLTMRQINLKYSPVKNLILFLVTLAITIIYFGFFFNLPIPEVLL